LTPDSGDSLAAGAAEAEIVALGAVGEGFSESQRPQALDKESKKNKVERRFMRSETILRFEAKATASNPKPKMYKQRCEKKRYMIEWQKWVGISKAFLRANVG
jgi:hypothetical protein